MNRAASLPLILSTALLLCASAATGQTYASYDAGTAGGIPATATDPATQGWTLSDPSGGQVGLSPLSPDGATGFNAWRIDDGVTFTGGRAHYGYLSSIPELDEIKDLGFELSMTMRVVSASGDDVFFEFATGTASIEHRYLIFFQVSGPDLIANDIFAGNTMVCPGGMDGGFHEFTIRRGGIGQGLDAEFLYDGQVIGNVLRTNSNPNAPNGGVNWGSGSSVATAIVHVNQVNFEAGTPPSSIAVTCDPASDHFMGDYVKLGTSSFGSGVGSDLHIEAIDGPVGEFGFVLVSPDGSANLNVFNGVLCLGSPQGRYNPFIATNQGLPVLNSLGQFDAAGVLQNIVGTAPSSGGSGYDVPLELPFSPAGQLIGPGDVYFFQVWYRDLIAVPGDSANFSNVIEVTFP